MNRIATALTNLFEKQRIVFWYDANREFREEFDALNLASVTKLEIANNEFGLKHRILRDEPDTNFLLYHHGPEPEEYTDNWLLDVQLSHGQFRTDQAAIWLADLELSIKFDELVRTHVEFFKSAKRREHLKSLLKPQDTPGDLRRKMLVVCAGSDNALDAVLEELLAELAKDTDENIRLITRCALDGFLFSQMENLYGYTSEKPSLEDFAICLFDNCYKTQLHEEACLSGEALVFFSRWKNHRIHAEHFEVLSARYAEVLSINKALEERDYRELMEMDAFASIDQKVLSDLVADVATQTISAEQVRDFIRKRRATHWFARYADIYEAVGYGAEFLKTLSQINVDMPNAGEAVSRYAKTWYRVDQLYRQFTYHKRQCAQATLLEGLAQTVEGHYTNRFLPEINRNWQTHVDAMERWGAGDVPLQRHFFQRYVQPTVKRGQKIWVIISDALRFEAGEEFLRRIRSQDRYDAEIEPMLSMLPSYTQLGMAALLPNQRLEILPKEGGWVEVDGRSSQGLENRKAILASPDAGCKAGAMHVKDFMDMNREETRALLREHDTFYFYHNHIDATGDDAKSENKAFDAVEQTFKDLLDLVKKLTNANASNILITADHGFLYQDSPLEESDYSGGTVNADVLYLRNRRFVIGEGIKDDPALKRFTASQLLLEGALEISVPNSVSRLRLQGSGSRFVHGGASLQEVVIPLVKINKKRSSDTDLVEVAILPGTTSTITSSQLSVRFYQKDAVTEKRQQRTLKAGIYSKNGDLISDQHELIFDEPSENARDREQTVRFLLSKSADVFNKQQVYLRLDEQHGGTSHFKEYANSSYTLRRSFTNDFDF